MNFSDKTKIEIVTSNSELDSRGLVAGFARGNLSLVVSGKRVGLVMTTDISEVASFMYARLFLLGAELSPENKKGLNSNKVYNISLQGDKAREFLSENGIVLFSGDKLIEICSHIPSFVQESEEIAKAYVAGAFLSCGSVYLPEQEKGSYQLEFTFGNEDFARNFLSFLSSLGFKLKYTERKELAVIYSKESETISDILAYVGAIEAMLSVQNLKVFRSVRNNENRKSNCEVGNIGKTVEAAQKQINAIQRLKDSGRFNLLAPALKEVAELRLNEPEEKLDTLAEKLGVSKSCINHRLRKIVAISEEE